MADLEIWWSSLPIAEKERIAAKALKKAAGGQEPDASLFHYPACTSWWSSLEGSVKSRIYAHCSARHGDELREWDDANPYGD